MPDDLSYDKSPIVKGDDLSSIDESVAKYHDGDHTDDNQQERHSSGLLVQRVRAYLETAFIVLGLLIVSFLLPRTIAGDGSVRYEDLVALLHQHILRATTSQNARYSLIGPAFALPLLIIGDLRHAPQAWVSRYNALLFDVSILMMYLALKDRIERGLLRKFFLLLIIASMFTLHETNFYGEVFTALCVGFGLLLLLGRRLVPLGWIAVILGVANTPAALLGLALMLIRMIFLRRRLRYAVILLAALCLIGLEAWLRRGSPFLNGYGNNHGFKTVMPYSGLSNFSYPFFFGILSILFSFGKGLVFFAPGLLLPVRKLLLRESDTTINASSVEHHATSEVANTTIFGIVTRWHKAQALNLWDIYRLWYYFLLGLILAYASWWAWYGGLFWGPRFFLFASIPASFALAISLKRHKETSLLLHILILLVFLLSVWVSIDGGLFNWSVATPAVCTQNNYALESLCWYTPEFSVLWYPFVKTLPFTTGGAIYAIYAICMALYLCYPLLISIAGKTWIGGSRLYRSVSVWREWSL